MLRSDCDYALYPFTIFAFIQRKIIGMDREKYNSSTGSIEKCDEKSVEKCLNYADKGNNLLQLIAEIIVEIIIKETSDEYNRKHHSD